MSKIMLDFPDFGQTENSRLTEVLEGAGFVAKGVPKVVGQKAEHAKATKRGGRGSG
jgi:hypothetical protein